MDANVSELQIFKAGFFKALAHPLRIRILELLIGSEHSVQELQTKLGADQPFISQQLGILRGKQVVTSRKEGTVVRYTVRDPLLGDLLAVARQIINNQLTGTHSMLRALRREAK